MTKQDHGTPNFETENANIEQESDHDANINARNDGAERSKWLRMMLMVLFLLVFGLVEAILYVITIVGFVVVLVKGEPIADVVRFGETLSNYARSIIRFLSYNTEQPPWPLDGIDSNNR